MNLFTQFSFVQWLSCAWLFVTPAFPVHHQLPELAQTHIHWVGDAIQPSHPLSSPSPLAFSLSQHQGLFQWVSSLHQVTKLLEFQLQHQSFQWIFTTDFLEDRLVGSPCSPRDSQESSPTPQFKSINTSVLSILYSPTLSYSVQFSCSVVSDSLRPRESQHTRPPCPLPTPGVDPNPCPLSPWCHRTISSSVVPFSSCPQSCPASGSFPVSQFFASGDQTIRSSASASILPMNIQDWFPLGCTCWISLQSKGLSRVFSNTTVQKHQYFGAQISL